MPVLMTAIQTDFFNPNYKPDLPHGLTPGDLADFTAILISRTDYITRRELSQVLGWDERKIRAAAQQLGGDVVRCQLGFKHRSTVTRDDLPYIKQAADAAGSQARIQLDYELKMNRLAHSLVG